MQKANIEAEVYNNKKSDLKKQTNKQTQKLN